MRGPADQKPVLRPPTFCPVHCRALLHPAGTRADVRGALCLPCLRRTPRAAFAVRLLAFRLASGLTRRELADRAGMLMGIPFFYSSPPSPCS
jgi:hypothetical protein